MNICPPALHRARPTVVLLVVAVLVLGSSGRLIAQASGAPKPRRPATAVHIDTMLVTVSGAQLHYVERGSGPAVVLVHGTFGELGDWDAQAAQLAAHYRVIAYSRRFHRPNAPPAPAAHYVMDHHAQDLAALIRTLGVAPVHIVAHSYGAYVALRLATLHPELVRSLVLAEPPVLGFLGGSPEADSVAAAFRAKALEPSRVAFMRGDSVDGVRRFLDGVSGRAGAFDGMPEQVRKAFLAAAGELRAEMTTPLPEYMTPLTCQQVRLVGKPVLLTQGEQSARMFHLINARLRPCFATADTLTVPRASHGSQVASPVFVDRVRAFLDAH